MKTHLLLLACFMSVSVFGQSIVHPLNNDAFLQNELAEIHISLSENDLNLL